MAGDARYLRIDKRFQFVSLNVKRPSETLATSLSEHPTKSRAAAETAAKSVFFTKISYGSRPDSEGLMMPESAVLEGAELSTLSISPACQL